MVALGGIVWAFWPSETLPRLRERLPPGAIEISSGDRSEAKWRRADLSYRTDAGVIPTRSLTRLEHHETGRVVFYDGPLVQFGRRALVHGKVTVTYWDGSRETIEFDRGQPLIDGGKLGLFRDRNIGT